jgi:hypothetical protein
LHDFTEALRLEPLNAKTALACAHVRIKQNEPHEAVKNAEMVVKSRPKDWHLWHEAVRISAQALGQIKPEPGLGRMRSDYQQRAVSLLRTAMELVPAGQRRACWREKVMKDPAFSAIRADLEVLGRQFGVRPP